jgi:hypothetical protein
MVRANAIALVLLVVLCALARAQPGGGCTLQLKHIFMLGQVCAAGCCSFTTFRCCIVAACIARHALRM